MSTPPQPKRPRIVPATVNLDAAKPRKPTRRQRLAQQRLADAWKRKAGKR